MLYLLFVQPVAYTQLICNIVLLSGFVAQLFSDVCHIDLQLFNAALVQRNNGNQTVLYVLEKGPH